MELLDLPPELFEAVIHELVSVTKAEGAWKLRSVCRTFRNAIEHETFANQPITIFEGRARKELLENNMGIYIYHRSKVPLDSHASLPTKINQMLSFLAESLELSGPQQIDTARQAICDILGSQGRALTFIQILDCGVAASCRNGFEENLTPEDKLFAAIATKNSELILRMVPMIDPCTWQVFLGWPVKALSKFGQEAALHSIFDLCRQIIAKEEPKSPLYLHRREAISSQIGWAIEEVIPINNLKLIRYLAKWHNEHIYVWHRSVHNKLIEAAIRADRASIVMELLEIPHRERKDCPRITEFQCRLVCKFGAVNTLKILIHNGLMDAHIKPKEKFYTTTPLVEAIRTKHLDIAELLVQAGADIEVAGSYKGEKMNAMQVAIKKGNVQAVEWLLSAGASLPVKIEWPKNKAICEVLRQAGNGKTKTT